MATCVCATEIKTQHFPRESHARYEFAHLIFTKIWIDFDVITKYNYEIVLVRRKQQLFDRFSSFLGCKNSNRLNRRRRS